MSAANQVPMHREFTGKAVASRVLLIGNEPGLSKSLEEGLTERNCMIDHRDR